MSTPLILGKGGLTLTAGADGEAPTGVGDGVALAGGADGVVLAGGADGVALAGGTEGVALAGGADGVALAGGTDGVAHADVTFLALACAKPISGRVDIERATPKKSKANAGSIAKRAESSTVVVFNVHTIQLSSFRKTLPY